MQKRFWLEKARKVAGFKQYELAEKAEISKGYYSAIENGMRKSPGDVALKISMLLDIPMELFYREEIQDWVDRLETRERIKKHA